MSRPIVLCASMIFAAFVGVGASVALTGAVWAAVSSNPSPISMSDSAPATPYPTTINVSDLSGTITDVNVTLHGVSHTFVDDVAVLLVGPSGQKVMLMSDAGGGQDLRGVDLTFDDEATRSLPDGAGTQITTGSYKPTQGANSTYKVPSSLPSPAPAGPYGSALSVFDGADPNGTYDLYVLDDAPGDPGQIAGGFSLDITAGANPTTTEPTTTEPTTTDRLPDLGMAHPKDLRIENTSDGRKLLRFSSIVVNVGAGKFEAHGQRAADASTMTTQQRIFDSAGGSRDVSTAATMYFGGDGHNHWHLRDLEDFELVRLDNGTKVGTGAKHGFCFYDNTVYGSSEPAYYTTSSGACGKSPSDTQVVMGLSVGWGDIYRWSLPDQYIDITGLTSGRYRLIATADASDWFLESDNSNNVSWINIQIKGNTAKIVAYGPSAPPVG